MDLILTSDFPATPNARVAATIAARAPAPRIAWIPPHTDRGGNNFAAARDQFAAIGLPELECVDIDEERDEVQIAYLHEFDVVYLSGGDPVRFRYNAMRSGLFGRLRQVASAGRLIVAASGGALLLTPNVSLYRLQNEPVEEVVASRGRFDGLGVVGYELLPHVNRWEPGFLDSVRAYSDRIDHDIVAVADGVALVHSHGDMEATGAITRYRKGNIIES
jgi:peptidase E